MYIAILNPNENSNEVISVVGKAATISGLIKILQDKFGDKFICSKPNPIMYCVNSGYSVMVYESWAMVNIRNVYGYGGIHYITLQKI